MKDLNLTRFCYAPTGTFGEFDCGIAKLYTVERPWLDNVPTLSCIPEGDFLCKPKHFNHGGYNAVEITNVKNRDNILFHIANKPLEVLGCIGVGLQLGIVDNSWAVLNSAAAFKIFMEEFGLEPFNLHIWQIKGAILGNQSNVS